MATETLAKEAQKGIARIKRLDVKQRDLEKTADQILATSAYGQAPPVYGRTLDKAIDVTKEKAKIWNRIRGFVIPGTGRTLWQVAIANRLPTVNYGNEEHLDFYAEDIEKLIPPKPTTSSKPTKEPWEMTGDEYIGARTETAASRTAEAMFGKPYFQASPDKSYVIGERFKDSRGQTWEVVGQNDLHVPYVAKVVGGKVQKKQYVGHERDMHKAAVAKALSEGKPVPAEVLKDYPELGKKEAPPGMVVGEQAGALGVPQKVHTQKSTGKAVTASMESFAKLQKARAEAAPKPAEVKEMLGSLSPEDATELLAGLDLRADRLGERIDQGKATLEGIKESVNPKIAKLTALIPTTKEGKGEITHITKGQYRKVWGREPKPNILTKDGKSVRWEYALDEIAQELHLEGKAQAEGKAPDEYLKNLIEEAKDTKELIHATESEIRSDESTLKALGKLKDTIKARTGKVTDGKLLQKLAKAPKVTVTTKPRPAIRAKAMLAGVAQALIEKTQAKRPLRAIVIDNALLAKSVVPVSRVETWAKHPNRLDIRGVDTPGRGRIVAGVAYADRGKQRLSRRHHRGFSRIKFT